MKYFVIENDDAINHIVYKTEGSIVLTYDKNDSKWHRCCGSYGSINNEYNIISLSKEEAEEKLFLELI